ncbi:MAG: hypothetical protein ACJ707_03235 [Nitrososphaera sp.]
MEFIDGDGNIIVPKAIRPVIDLKETPLGSKKGAKRQYRYGALHIREYETHYGVHTDSVGPSTNSFGHLFVDAPEYLASATAAFIIGRGFGTTVYNISKKEGKSTKDALIDAVLSGYIAGSAAGNLVFNIANSLKRKRSE